MPGASVRELEADRPIPIGGGQVTTQPSLLAAMVEALALEGSERVLEVGTGLGYQAAIPARLAREVWTLVRLGLVTHARFVPLVGRHGFADHE